MRYILDRFEGSQAVVEASEPQSCRQLRLPRAALPESAKEGDVLSRDETGWQVDELATAERRRQLRMRFQTLLRPQKGGERP